MKRKITNLLGIGLCLIGLNAKAQYTISVEGNYGFRAYNRPLNMNGTYEGITLGYNKKMLNVQLWNTDLTRLQHLHDTVSRNSFGAEYGMAIGSNLHLLRAKAFSIQILPQVGTTFITRGTLDASERDQVFYHHFNPIIRGQLILNYQMFYVTGGYSHTFTSLSHPDIYFERTWIGIGIRQ